MFRKTLFAVAATALSFGGLAATSTAASAGGYGHRHVYVQQHIQVYTPVYKTVCEPVYRTIKVWDAYSYSWVWKTVFVGNKCYRVQIY